jgi:hypothetical protein
MSPETFMSGKNYTPCEASRIAQGYGVFRSARWFVRMCKQDRLSYLPCFGRFFFIKGESLAVLVDAERRKK